MPEIVKKRCGVYCRKSTDENLSSDFNSLDAQREAAENYIASQKANGWVCLPEVAEISAKFSGELRTVAVIAEWSPRGNSTGPPRRRTVLRSIKGRHSVKLQTARFKKNHA